METDLGPEGDVDRPYGRISLKQESEPLSESGREKGLIWKAWGPRSDINVWKSCLFLCFVWKEGRVCNISGIRDLHRIGAVL